MIIKAGLQVVWRTYTNWCMGYPRLAIPMPVNLAGYGRVKAHPAYFRHAWDRDEDGLLRKLAKLLEGKHSFIDVGANIGLTAMIGAKQIGTAGTIVAFEPSPQNAAMLRYHLRANGHAKVKVEEMCAGNSVGEIEFSILDGGLSASNSLTFSQKSNPPFVQGRAHTIRVTITTLDDYCKNSGLRPDLIKIDVEGAELDVLRGAEQILRECRPVLVMGVHPFWWPDSQLPDALANFLSKASYRVQTLHGESAVPDSYKDFVCIPDEV